MNKKLAIALALSLIAIVCCAGCILPSGPVDPVDPVDPADPVDPITPVDPVVPEDPVEPVVPAEGDFTVTFMMNSAADNSVYLTEYVDEGETVAEPAVPEKPKENYIFVKWTTDKDNKYAYDFSTPVTADLVLYADWDVKGTSSGSSYSGSSHTHVYKTGGMKGDQYGLFCSCGAFKASESIEDAIQDAPAGATINLKDVTTSTEPIVVGNNAVIIECGDNTDVKLEYAEDTPIQIKADSPNNVKVIITDEEAGTEKTVIFEDTPDETTGLLVPAAAVDEDNCVGDAYTASGLLAIASLVNKPLAAPVEDAPTEHVQDGWTVLFYEPAPTNLGDEAVESEATDESKSWTITLKDDIYLEGKTWTPIGIKNSPFIGTFDGQGHTIHDLKITGSTDYVGLIGSATGEANSEFSAVNNNVWANNALTESSITESKYTTVIKNIKLENVSVEGDERVGALVGFAENTYIYDCDVTSGAVKGTKYLGGLVGQINDCVVKDCSNAAAVTGSDAYNYGGVIGAARGSNANAVINCMNTGTLDFTLSDGGSGGIVGQYSTAGIFVYNCENSGNIKVTSTVESNTVTGKAVAAGIVGTSGGAFDSVIAKCKNSGDISTTTNSKISGQLSGIASNFGKGLIYNCENSGDISGNALYVGGICAAPGTTPLEINGCTNAGNLSNTNVQNSVSTIVAYCKGEVTYSNMAFASGDELASAIPVASDSSKVTLTETVKVSGNIFNAEIIANGNLVIVGDNIEITLTGDTNLEKLTITGNGAKVTTGGTIGSLICDKSCTVINSGTISALTINAEKCSITNEIDATINGITIKGKDSTVTNNGTVCGGIGIYANSTITNNGLISTTGDATSMRIWTDGVTVTVNNNGEIENVQYYVYWIEVNNAKFIVNDGEGAKYTVSSVSHIERVVTSSGNTQYTGSSIERTGNAQVIDSTNQSE